MKNCITAILFIGVMQICCGKSAQVPQRDTAGSRVLGYLFYSGNWMTAISGINLQQLTDLNLAFINPDAAGNFPENNSIRQLIEKAHGAGVRVYLSFGGGNAPGHLAGLITANQRQKFIESLVATTTSHGFDGIDVDLENALITADYGPFIHDLAKATQKNGLYLTAALASWNADQISTATLQAFDYINIMSYDKTGPWAPAQPGQHAPFAMTVDDFQYFHQTRGIAADRLLLGLPFYGYGFGAGVPESMTYRDILANYPGAETSDAYKVPAGGTIYYNGIGTIRQKVNYALEQKARGVMIWQLLGDAPGEQSLLTAIHKLVSP